MLMTVQPARAWYVPAGAAKISPKAAPAVTFYRYKTKAGDLAAVCFVGKAAKPRWRYSFRSEEKLADYMKRTVAAEVAREEAKRARRAERSKPHDLKIGDVFSCSWGYEQTNVDFYEVTAIKGANSVEIRKIASSLTDEKEGGCSMSGYVLPAPGSYIGEPMLKRVSSSRFGPSIRIASYATASLWDGRPRRVSWYG